MKQKTENEGSYKGGNKEMSNVKVQMSKISIFITAVVFSVFIVSPLSVRAFSFDELFNELDELFSEGASSTQIINEINVSANTGGNVATNGEIIEGEAKTEVEIKNIINGKEIEPVKIETKASEVSVNSEITVEEGMAQVQREIEIDSEKTSESYEIDLGDAGNSKNDEVSGEVLNDTQGWWLNFLEGFRSFFQNIFNIF